MALIVCPECKSEISDQAKKCPHCGCPVRGNKKIFNRNFLIIFIVVVVICVVVTFFLFSAHQRNKRQERINSVDKGIETITNEGVPSQEDYDNVVKLYNGLSEDEKAEIKDANQLDKYKDVDLKTVKKISEQITSIGEDTPFSDIVALENEYKNLSTAEQKLLDISAIKEKKSMSKIEKAALAAVNNVKSVMQSKDDFKLYSVAVKNDLKKMKFYWVKVKYSGTNSWGASIDKTSFFPIDSEFEDPFFGLASITGMDDYLDSVTNFNSYTDCKEEEHIVDVDKIEYYMD